jgi:O-antigen ligase
VENLNHPLNVFDSVFLILSVFLVLLFEILFKYPEIYFALFLTAGVYKADPRLSFLPKFFDLTVFFEILTILGIIYNLLRKRLKFILPPPSIFLSYVLIMTLAILSLSYTLAPGYGTDKLLRFLFITSPAFFFSIILFQKRETYIRFVIVFVILAIIIAFDIITGGLNPGELGFHGALGSNYLAVGRISGIAIFSALQFFIVIRQKLYKFCLIFIIGLAIFSMFISGGRGPLVAFISSIVLLIIYLGINLLKVKRNKFVLNKRNLKVLSYIVLLFILALFIVIYFRKYFFTMFYRMMLLESSEGASIKTRLQLYSAALNSIKNFPRNMVGLGIGGFSVLYLGYDVRLYPHNIFLEIASELGILAFFSFVFIIYRSFVRVLDNIRESKTGIDYYLNLGLFLNFTFMLINSSVSGDINDNRLLFAILGLIYAYWRILRNES